MQQQINVQIVLLENFLSLDILFAWIVLLGNSQFLEARHVQIAVQITFPWQEEIVKYVLLVNIPFQDLVHV